MPKSYHVSAPARLSIQSAGADLGRGGIGGALQAASSGSPGIDVGAAFNNFMGSVLGSAQVFLGLVLVGLGVAVVISSTSAGSAIGGGAARGAGGLAKRGLRLIPGVGAVV